MLLSLYYYKSLNGLLTKFKFASGIWDLHQIANRKHRIILKSFSGEAVALDFTHAVLPFILKIIGGICVYEGERQRALQPPL